MIVSVGHGNDVYAQRNDSVRHGVILTDPACEDIAGDYARHEPSRSVYRIDDLDDIPASTDLFVIAAPSTLNRNVLERLVAPHRRGSVGLACGNTPQDLHAFLALQLRPAQQLSLPRAVMLDELHDRELVLSPGGADLIISGYPCQPIRPYLGAVDLLGMHVHGEGAHGNLRHLVLCGHSADADPDDSCTSTVCKRAQHSPEGRASFGEITADTVMLLSCSGFSVAREHYPSSTSAVLATVAGRQVRTLLCNDRTVPLSPDEVEIAFRVAIQDGAVGAQCFLNDLVAHRFDGNRPWLLVGDPAATSGPIGQRLVSRRRLPRHDRRYSVILARETSRPVALAAGQFVFADINSRPDIRPFSEELHRAEAAMRLTGQLCFGVDLLLDDLKAPELQLKLDELRRTTAKVGRATRLVARALAVRRSLGVMTDDVLSAFGRASVLASLYGHQVVTAITPLLDRDLNVLISSLGHYTSRRVGSKCQRCHLPLVVRGGFVWPADGILITDTDCTTCGPRQVVLGKPPETTVTAAPVWNGQGLPVTVDSRDPDVWIGVSMKDKATGANLFHLGPVHPHDLRDVHMAPIPTPSADLHTVRVLTVGAEGLSIERFRVATRL